MFKKGMMAIVTKEDRHHNIGRYDLEHRLPPDAGCHSLYNKLRISNKKHEAFIIYIKMTTSKDAWSTVQKNTKRKEK